MSAIDVSQLEDEVQLQILEDSLDEMYDLPLIKKMHTLKFERDLYYLNPEAKEQYTELIKILDKDFQPLWNVIKSIEARIEALRKKKIQEQKQYRALRKKRGQKNLSAPKLSLVQRLEQL